MDSSIAYTLRWKKSKQIKEKAEMGERRRTEWVGNTKKKQDWGKNNFKI